MRATGAGALQLPGQSGHPSLFLLIALAANLRQSAKRHTPTTKDSDLRELQTPIADQNKPRGDHASIAASLSGCIQRIATDADEAAFAQVFRYFAPRLKSFFLRLGGDVSSAEEIAQEALVLVWRRAGQFDPGKSSASTWIFTIARNLSIDRFRRSRRPQFDPADPAFVPDGEISADIQLERAEMEQKVREIMNSLSPNEKIVLMLSYYENRSHAEIARQLNLPLGTVKSRIRLAFTKIRAALKEQVGADE